MLWMLAACDLRVSVDASILVSVLWLMLLVMVLSLTSMVSTKSFMALLKSFSETNGVAAAWLLMACAFCAIASRTGAWARRMAVEFGAEPSMLPLCGTKSTRRPKMYADLCSQSVYTAAFKH